MPSCVIVPTGSRAPLSPSAGPPNRPKPSSLFAPRVVQLNVAQVRCKRRSCTKRKPCPNFALSESAHLDVITKVPTGAFVIYTDGGCDDTRKSRVMQPTVEHNVSDAVLQVAQADNRKPAGWGSCVFEMAPGDSSAGLGRMKPIAQLYGPVVTDESDPLSMGADGH